MLASPSSRPRVLAAEDHPVNRRLMEFLFSDLGCDLTLVNDGHQALDALHREKFDVVFVDLHMPNLDGFKTSEAIHEMFGESGPPVFAVSADDSEETRAHCTQSAISDLLPKPLTIESIQSALRNGHSSKESVTAVASREETWTLPDGLALLASMGKGDRVARVLRLFISDAGSRMQNLIEAIRSHDRKKTESVAHSLRGSAAQMGADNLARQCRDLEALAGKTSRVPFKQLVAVVREFDHVEKFIIEYLKVVDPQGVSPIV